MMYVRIFIQILDSSLAQNWQARHVFEDMLKLADPETGVLDMTREALVRRTNVPPEIVNSAIAYLEAPDPMSRDDSHEGRRIIRLDEKRDWGWMILNAEKYREILSRADEREKTRQRVADYRARQRQAATTSPLPLTPSPNKPEVEVDIEKEYTGRYIPVTKRNNPLQGVTLEAEILAYLNEKTGRKFREVKPHLKLIISRLKEVEGDIEGIKAMIDRQVKLWGRDPKMGEYLRPATLFAATNFHQYYDLAKGAVKKPMDDLDREIAQIVNEPLPKL